MMDTIPRKYYFGLSLNELFFLPLGSVLAAVIFLLFFPDESLWVYLGVGFTAFVLGQMCLMAGRVVILPELIVFVTCIQWILAPWLSYRFPPSYFLYVMNVPQSEYFSFMVPSAIALWVGLHLPMSLSAGGSRVPAVRLRFSRQESRFWDAMILFGFTITMTASHLPQDLKFFYYILGQLRFVGAFALMFAAIPGWGYRVVFVYATLLLDTSAGAIFYEFILWSGYLFISFAHVKKWRWKLLVFLAGAFTVVVLLNNIKGEFRRQAGERDLSNVESLQLLGKLFLGQDIPVKSAANGFEEQIIGDRLVRYNQGWIISRVLTTVPAFEPYAGGSTIIAGIKASLVPRVFYKNKVKAGSREFFKKYTDLNLAEGTSMALGIAGEMYVNFGKLGGISALLVYGMLIGYCFSRFARLAKSNPIWWAWAPFVLLSAVEAEWNLVEVLNNIVKALLVMLAMIHFIPLLKRRMTMKLWQR